MNDQQPKQPAEDDLLAKAIPIEPDDDDAPPIAEGDELEPVDMDLGESQGQAQQEKPKIRTFGQRVPHEEHWQRKPNATGQGAIHVKTFVSKLRLEAIEHLDEQINNWLDAHPEYEVKFVTTSVGVLTGKTREEAVFVNVWV